MSADDPKRTSAGFSIGRAVANALDDLLTVFEEVSAAKAVT